MPVRVRTQILVVASLGTDEKRKQFDRSDTATSTVIESFDLEQSGELELGAGEVDYVLEKGKIVTGRYLYIETDRELLVKFDGEAVGHKIGTPSTGTLSKMCWRTEFTTAPTVTNLDGANPAQIGYFMAGDKA